SSLLYFSFFFFSSRRRHTRFSRDWSSDVCSSDLPRQAFRTVAWACLGTLQANLAHLALDADALAAAAFVHHSRAALARLLAALEIGRASCRERVQTSGVAVA